MYLHWSCKGDKVCSHSQLLGNHHPFGDSPQTSKLFPFKTYYIKICFLVKLWVRAVVWQAVVLVKYMFVVFSVGNLHNFVLLRQFAESNLKHNITLT